MTEDELQEILNRAADNCSGTESYMDMLILVDQVRKIQDENNSLRKVHVNE